MIGFVKCAGYSIIIGIAVFLTGRLLSRFDNIFRADRFPFKPFTFEKNGTIYNKLNVRSWQAKVPDMSKIFTKLMPAKKCRQTTKRNFRQ